MKKVNVIEHGIVRRGEGMFGYYGWPSVTRTEDNRLLVVASGNRINHICPFGKSVMFTSYDNGASWSEPTVIGDTLIDDRDSGILDMGEGRLLETWFSFDIRLMQDMRYKHMNVKEYAVSEAYMDTLDDEIHTEYLGSYIRRSLDNGKTWLPRQKVPVTTPHGPIKLRNGDILYFGKEYKGWHHTMDGRVQAYLSHDFGETWELIGEVPFPEDTHNTCFHEPSVVELPSGRLIGMIRYQHFKPDYVKYPWLSIFSTYSDDGGRTWSTAKPTGVLGTPPHLMRHSDGTLICVYGRRDFPFGQMAMISRDDGETWEKDLVLRDDGINWDLGYPCSTELEDGSIFTVYYQILPGDRKASILWTRWRV